MNFGELEEEDKSNPTVKFYQNGNAEHLVAQISLKRKITSRELQERFVEAGARVRNLRIFTREGVEVGEEELRYVKDGEVLFLSKGEEFDRRNCLAEYVMLEVLGEGGFGKVMLGEHRVTKKKVAIKFIKHEKSSGFKDLESIFKESQILCSLRHDNIVRTISCQPIPGMQVIIIMEYLGGGEVLSLVDQRGRLTELESKTIFKQLVRAMEFCHQRGLIHRDLKLENLIFAAKGSLHIKVVDFGIAGAANAIDPKDIDMGTLRYMAPQLFIEKKVGPFVDVWSAGVILYCLLFGQMPFEANSPGELMQTIKKRKSLVPKHLQKLVSKQAIQVLQSCLDLNFQKRAKMSDLLGHPWLQEVNVYELVHKR